MVAALDTILTGTSTTADDRLPPSRLALKDSDGFAVVSVEMLVYIIDDVEILDRI